MKTEVENFLAIRQVLYHLYTGMFDDMQKRLGMTQMEINILLFLANNPDMDTAAEVVSACRLSKSQVSMAVENLAQKGYLSRMTEGRRIHLQLLPAADEVIREGAACRKEFTDMVLEGVSPEERERLNVLLLRVAENAREAIARMDGAEGTA